MKLLQEADIDDQFNQHMDKIQQAIIKLEQLAAKFDKAHYPVGSQVRALEAAAQDLGKLAKSLQAKRP